MCNCETVHHFISDNVTGRMRNNKNNEMEKCWDGCQFYHLEEITYLSGPHFLNLYERRSLSLWLSSPITRQSLFKEFSKGTCPGKVSLIKQDCLKPGNPIHLRIKIVLMNIVQSPKLLVHVCLCVCVHIRLVFPKCSRSSEQQHV